MRISSLPLALAAALAWCGVVGTVSADPPQKPRLMQYARLWMNSPFTIKPVNKPEIPESPLERDWMLGGIRPSGGGYSVTLINKKDRNERIRFLPGYPSGGYQLLKVQQDTKNPKNSRVQVRKGSQTAWITYDEKLIKVRPMTGAKTAGKQPQQARRGGVARPPVPGRSGNPTGKKPRIRAVPRKGR